MTAPMHDVVGVCLVCLERYYSAEQMASHRRLCGSASERRRCERKASR